jgi:hypothetical protein
MVVLMRLRVQRMRPFHNGCRRRGLVIFNNYRSLHVPIAMHNGRMVINHGPRCRYAFAATRILG